MPYVQTIGLIQDEQDQLEHLVKHAKHYKSTSYPLKLHFINVLKHTLHL